ncbi:hypothetical protein [Chlorobium sp.]|uniref:hypothetical protein n=1 Tax=Chlorobium sp. TaxID=1095 RepID=UPI003C5176EB
MPLSDEFKAAMLAGGEAFIADGGILRMHTGDPGAAGTANLLAPGNGYAHLTGVAFSVNGLYIDNDNPQVLGVRTGGGNIQLTHFSLFKANGTSRVMHGPLAAPATYAVNGDPPVFSAHTLRTSIADPA